MQAYWNDVRLLFQRVRGTQPVVVHVEPDLWGYLEQANAVALASSFAQQWVTLRGQLLHASFDVAFEDFSDRDSGFYEKVQGNPNTWFTPADFHRHLL